MKPAAAIDKLRRRLTTLSASISLASPPRGNEWRAMITRTLAATEVIDPPDPVLTPELVSLLTVALEAAVDCANEVAHTTHTAYAGYKPNRHAAVDADVEAIANALAALKVAAQQVAA